MIEHHPLNKAIGFKIIKSKIEGDIDDNIALEKFKIETRNYSTKGNSHGLGISRLKQIFYHMIK